MQMNNNGINRKTEEIVMKTGKTAVAKNVMLSLFLAGLVVVGAILLPGCGSGGQPAVQQSTTVTGMVVVPTTSATLARLGIKPVSRQAALAVTACGTVPPGMTPVPDAAITVSGYSATATTDSEGCFSMTLTREAAASTPASMGTLIFRAAKTNTAGGTTILKKAANVTSGTTVQLIDDDSISVSNTLAALIIERKIQDGETNIDPDAIESFVEAVDEQEDVQALYNAILTAGDVDADGLDAISESLVQDAEEAIDKPAIWSAAVTGSPVAATGGNATVSAKVAAYGEGNSVASVSATLTPTGGAAIPVTMAEDTTTAGLYSGSYNFSAHTDTDATVYSVSIDAVDANGATATYATASLTITHSGVTSVCGNGTQETGEACDDSNTTTEICTYGQTSCTVCDATCQSVAGAVSYCGDGTTDASNSETCDDSNAVTETCAYGQTSCTVCNATCQSVAGATSYCGDGTTDTANGEACDGDTGCNASCQYNPLSSIKGTIAGTTTTGNIGKYLATADVDGDGKDEVIVGSYSANSYAGGVFVYDDDGATLLAQIDGTELYSNFGIAVASAGDVDGDGKDEILIGENGADPDTKINAGSVYLYDDDGSTLLARIDGEAAGDSFGATIASAGDVDGDGKDEILIGARNADPGGNDGAGSAYLYDDNATTLLARMDGVAEGDAFGDHVASAGDVDGDGKAEILIAATDAEPGGNENAGSVYLYDHDGATLLGQLDGAAEQDRFGDAVGSAGDVDGDGKAEILIGAPYTDPGGNNAAGSFFLYDDDFSTLLSQQDGTAPQTNLGSSVLPYRDVDGDGKAEFLVAAARADNYTGAVYLYDDDGATILYQAVGEGMDQEFGKGVAVGDFLGAGSVGAVIGAPYCPSKGKIYIYR